MNARLRFKYEEKKKFSVAKDLGILLWHAHIGLILRLLNLGWFTIKVWWKKGSQKWPQLALGPNKWDPRRRSAALPDAGETHWRRRMETMSQLASLKWC